MTGVEIVQRYNWLMKEADTIKRQADKVMSIGQPAGVAGQQITGMPHGGNDPLSAQSQIFDAYIEKLRKKVMELVSVGEKFEEIVGSLDDDRDRVIIRSYYALDMTDESIAKEQHMDTSSINVIRNKALQKISQNSMEFNNTMVI